MAPLDQRQFIFVDETSTSIAMIESYARAPRGQQAYGVVPRNPGRNLLVIEALGLKGLKIFAAGLPTAATWSHPNENRSKRSMTQFFNQHLRFL